MAISEGVLMIIFKILHSPFRWLKVVGIDIRIYYSFDSLAIWYLDLYICFFILLSLKVIESNQIILIYSIIHYSHNLFSNTCDNTWINYVFDMPPLPIPEQGLLWDISVFNQLSKDFRIHQTSICKHVSGLSRTHKITGFIKSYNKQM